MNKGIIIIFGENDLDETNSLTFKSFFNQKVKICLVNNGNHDNVLRLLNKLKDSSMCDISILNLRKEKKMMSAVKAGVRFLSKNENINIIIHANLKNILNSESIDKVLEAFEQELNIKKEERVLLRSVYSINEL